jgi:hypothetical protein
MPKMKDFNANGTAIKPVLQAELKVLKRCLNLQCHGLMLELVKHFWKHSSFPF